MTNVQLQLRSEIPLVNNRIVYVVRAEMNESRSAGRNSGRRVRKSEWVSNARVNLPT